MKFKNHLANFKETWHKETLDEGDSSLFKLGTIRFSKRRQ